MNKAISVGNIFNPILGIIVFVIGVLNVFLVHIVPGLAFLLLSIIFFLPNTYIMDKFGFTIPLAVKIMLGIIVIWFTLGVSDLGDMIDDL